MGGQVQFKGFTFGGQASKVGFTSHKPHQGLPHEGGMRAQSIARPGQPLWLNHGQAGKGWGGTVGRQKGTAHRRPHTS